MNYNPNISIKENALNNGVSEAAVRKYIKVHRIDRRYDQNLRVYLPIKKLLNEHPDWSARAIARELGIAPATVCHYKNKGISKQEGKISLREAYRCLDFDTSTPIDFMKMEEYDGSKVGIVAFSKGTFKYNGNSIGFGNMRSFPIEFFGHRFDCPETAYIACCYGLNNADCIRIQKEIQASTNGLKCKRQYRYNETDREYGRKDFHQSEWHFNLMLYLVWHKCLKYPDFGEMLLAIPDNVAIIENQNGFKKVKVGDWGCKNPEAKEAYDKRLAELKGSGKATGKMKEAATIDTWNVGKWSGCNHQGKILMACRSALRTGTEPCIDYQALNDAEIYLFGEKLTFSNDARDTSTSSHQLGERLSSKELFEVCTYNKEESLRPFDYNSILSNFYPFDFSIDGLTFHCTEQYYHWRRLQGCPEYQQELLSFAGERNAWDCYYYIRGRKKPKVRLDKSVTEALEMDYEKRFDYMREALRHKLTYCKGFREALLDTGDKIIAEKDQTRKKQDIWAIHKGKGANILGKLLMELRNEIRNPGTPKSPTPKKEAKFHKNHDRKNRLLGAIIGDMAGSLYEQAKKNVYEYDKAVLFPDNGKSNKLTDDSVLTIAVAHYLLDNDTLTIEGLTKMVHRYAIDYPLKMKLNWGSGETSMYGKGFQKWIENPVPYQGDTNGCAMRVSSVGWLCDSIEQVMEVAKFTADISHNSIEGERGAQAIALCVFLARTGKTKQEIKKAVQELIRYELKKDCDMLREETREYIKEHKHIPVKCIDSVPNAITAFLESKDYEDAIRLAISLGGDSDTIACMCGAIAGAYYDDIPSWLVKRANRKMSKSYKPFREILERMDDAKTRHYTITNCPSVTPKPKRTNSNLHKARAAKNDEYYTPLNEITKELRHYKKHFQGKTILCNCDSPDTSNFVKYFVENFSKLGLRKLVAVAFSATEKGSLYVYDGNEGRTILMKGNGDFRSEESIKHLLEADIVVTNPPFSLFREYVKQLLTYNKQFLIIGNKNAISYSDIATAIKYNKIWSGCRSYNGDMMFMTPTNEKVNVAGCWFTNLEHNLRHKPIKLTKLYNEKEYPKYDNCDAIEVGRIKNIPCDYTGVMGVPLSFINQYCPEQFEIVGFLYGDDGKHLRLNGKETYFRVLIKRITKDKKLVR